MRPYSTLALVSSALALAACGGGGGGLSSGTASRAQVLAVCGIQDTKCEVAPGTPTTPALPDSDGDGIPDKDDKDGGVGSGAGGNSTGLSTGNRTIAIQSSVLDKPTTGATALSSLTSEATPTAAATTAAILSTNKPKSLKFSIDTKSGKNSQWAVPVEQKEFVDGTRELTWIEFNHTTQDLVLRDTVGNPIAFGTSPGGVPNSYFYLSDHTTSGGVAVSAGDTLTAADLASPFYANQLSRFLDPNGKPLLYQPSRNGFIATAAHTVGDRSYNSGNVVDIKEDFYWNQLVPFMGSKANGGAKAGYREYRAIDTDPTVNRDEVLQVWAWGNDSYSSHYVNRDGEDPKQHAWGYGGNASTTMPTSGSATYKGRFVGNAKSSNWIKPDGAEVDPNAAWRIQGRSELNANFGTNDIRGTLSTETWTSYQAALKGYYTWYTAESENGPAGEMKKPRSVGTGLRPNYYEIYDAQVALKGKITASPDASGATPAGGVLNSFNGTATLNNPYITGGNALNGGFFGANGKEVTGVFSVSGATVDPIGGSNGLNGDRGAFLDMNGSFNACKVDAAGLCTP